MGFFADGSWEKDTENVAAVMPLRYFLFCDDFSNLYWLYDVHYTYINYEVSWYKLYGKAKKEINLL